MAIVLALFSALGYGLSDFVGGVVSRRTSAWAVAVVVQLTATVPTAAVALLFAGSPEGVDLSWGLLAGIGSGVGVGFLYRGFSRGRMSVVAPLSAVGAALVPVTVGLLLGERPGLLVSLAIVAALPGIWLVAQGEGATTPSGQLGQDEQADGRTGGSGVLDGVLAGIGFGVMFAALGQVPEEAGLWPLTLALAVSTVAVAGLASVLGHSWWPDRGSWAALPAGPLSAVAVVCFQLATRSGLLAVSSVLASLYPAATILLAMAVLRERIHPGQAVGLVLCGFTVALVALG